MRMTLLDFSTLITSFFNLGRRHKDSRDEKHFIENFQKITSKKKENNYGRYDQH